MRTAEVRIERFQCILIQAMSVLRFGGRTCLISAKFQLSVSWFRGNLLWNGWRNEIFPSQKPRCELILSCFRLVTGRERFKGAQAWQLATLQLASHALSRFYQSHMQMRVECCHSNTFFSSVRTALLRYLFSLRGTLYTLLSRMYVVL